MFPEELVYGFVETTVIKRIEVGRQGIEPAESECRWRPMADGTNSRARLLVFANLVPAAALEDRLN